MKKITLLELEKSNSFVAVEKLSNEEFYRLGSSKFAPIFEDYYFLMVLDRVFYEKYDFSLPEIYTALYSQYGMHNGYDDYKCSFSYRFRLKVVYEKNIYIYLLSIMDMKGNPPYFTFYRQLGDHEMDKKGTYQKPIETEFPKEVMQEFMLQFLINLYVKFESIKDTFKKPFFRTVPYINLIYGFKNGVFFQDLYFENGKKKGKSKKDDADNLTYTEAIAFYKNNPKMKGKMSQRYD